MSLPVPIVGVDPGPDWASNYNASLSILDQHNHSSGSGVQINQSGINLTANATTFDSLNFNTSNAYGLRSVKFVNQSSTLGLSTDVGSLYESGSNLYFNNGAGVPVQLTSGNSIVGTAGSISGLPSGTASASYSGGTFTFQSATSTPAAFNVGPITIGQQVASPNQITIQSPNSLSASYQLTLPTPPANFPAANNFLMITNTGNLSASNTSAQLLTLTGGITITGGATTDTLTVTGALIAQDYLQLGSGGPEVSNVGASIIQTTAAQFYLNSSVGSAGLDGSFGLRALGIKTDLGSASFPIVVSAAPASNGGLMIVRGTVATGASSLSSGEGATVSYNSGTELYTITFTTAFGDVPAVTVTPHVPSSSQFFTSGAVVTLSASGFTCSAGPNGSGFVTSGFSFIAIGQRGA
jgi:hypothetical protein